MPVDVLVGGQYGSEGKGVIAAHLANEYHVHVRTGSPNAGHSLVHEGKVFKMQQIPCGWINYEAQLIIGRGALINPEILEREIEMIEEYDENIRKRVYIDPYAGILEPRFAEEEGHTEGEIHKRIGSTGEGVGAARRARMARVTGGFWHAGNYDNTLIQELIKGANDTPKQILTTCQHGGNVLLEGTQGCGLSLIHGYWPYVTSTDTNAAQLCADAGVSPLLVKRIIMVLRTYPIRVAGNSGPLWQELAWGEVAERAGFDKLEEKTTVTKLVRRVGEWDWEEVMHAIRLNMPTHLALNFADYLDSDNAGEIYYEDLAPKTKSFIQELESMTRVSVAFVGTGRNDTEVDWQVIDRRPEDEDAE